MNSLDKSRRQFLRAAGSCALLLPFWMTFEKAALANSTRRRVVFLFFPHGTPSASGFWPGATDRLGQLTGVLAPMNEFREKMLIVGGLGGALESGYGHNGGNTAVLTGRGSTDQDDGLKVPRAASLDWILARRFNQDPLLAGVNAASGSRHIISWAQASKAGARVPVNSVPELFMRIYGRSAAAGTCEGGELPPPPPSPGTPPPSGGSMEPPPSTTQPQFDPEKSILDSVAKDIQSLKANLPSWGKHALDEQLDGVRDLERAVAATKAASLNLADGSSAEGCYATNPSDFFKRGQLHSDLITSALQNGSRRVALLQHGAASGDSFSVPGFGGYHGEVHNLSGPGNKDATRVTRMQTEIFKNIAYLVKRLATTRDMTGDPLLNNTLVYICTEFGVYKDTDDSHMTNANFAVALLGGHDYFGTTGKSISAKGSFAGVLVEVANYMGAGIETIGKHTAVPGLRKS